MSYDSWKTTDYEAEQWELEFNRYDLLDYLIEHGEYEEYELAFKSNEELLELYEKIKLLN